MTSDPTVCEAALAALTPARLRNGVLTLTIALPAPQQEVWEWITSPERLATWSPVVPDRPLTSAGPATSVEQPGEVPVDATVGESRAPWFLEHRWGPEQLTWQLAPSGEGTQLNLVHELSDPASACETAAGWHLCLTVLGRLVEGVATPRCVGADALDNGWAAVKERYAKLFEGEKAQA